MARLASERLDERETDGLTAFEKALQTTFDHRNQTKIQGAVERVAGRVGDKVEASNGDEQDEEETSPEGGDDEEVQSQPDDGTSSPDEETTEEGTGDVEAGDELPPIDDDLEDVYEFDGRDFRESDLKEAVALHDWARSLPPQAIQAMDALLSGQYVLVPASQAGATTVGSPAGAGGATGTTIDPANSALEDDEAIDPVAHQRIQQMEAELNALRQQQSSTQETEQVRIIRDGQAAFQTKHNLTAEEVNKLANTVAQMGVLPAIIEAQNGNLSTALDRALEMAYWDDPVFQNREMNLRLEKERQEAQQTTQRKRRAGSVATNGGSVSRSAPAPRSAQERSQAMADELRASMNGGQEA